MKSLNFLEACSIMGDVLALRMALDSNKGAKAMSSLMPPKICLVLLRVRLPWSRIERVTFYILRTIMSTKLGKFMSKPHNVSHHAFMYKNGVSSSRHSTHIKMPKKKIPNASNAH
jgi:hypothetical protein